MHNFKTMNYKKQVENFLKAKSKKQKLIVIYGPTGAGKTAMSIEIAKMLDTEIISTDSRQIYRGMDIGTGKIMQNEMQGIPHHMIDIIDPDVKYSAGMFKKESEKIIKALYKKGKIPMLVGGTGLYIDSLIFDMNIGNVPNDSALREKFETLSTSELFFWLQDIDPEYAGEIHPNNRPYIERGIEVKITTGTSKRDMREERKLTYDVLFLTPYTGNREELYIRINTRVEQMFEEGLEQEVTELIAEGYCLEDEGMKAIGYQEFFPYLRGEMTREECIALVQQHSRNYAKKQINWFSKYQKYFAVNTESESQT
ncbi:tRNA (adenosine(37)-N6)-dimethylallyltransferase MiaA [Candidatus Gracilibacteria bacterium]|nr:tRNA (adenosine(37)-N6)-dimethylallyltransferase MiaA [Candidatus Gracilibacteria bacterium]